MSTKYNLAFFLDYSPFFTEKLQFFLENTSREAWICNPIQDKQLQSLDELPNHSGYWYSQPWYLHGASRNQVFQQNFPKLPIYTGPQYPGTSLEDINIVLRWLANNYTWSIFPWGGPGRFLGFAFLSTDPLFCHQFLNIVSNTQEISRPFNISQTYNLFITQYEVIDNFSDIVQALLFSGYHEPAERIWDVCDGDNHPPLLITNIFDDDIFSIFSWGSVTYKMMSVLPSINENSTPLAVYQPLNRQSFKSMCMLSTQEPDTLIFVPEDTDLTFLHNLLPKIETRFSYSDLCYFQDILSTTRWFYGLDRDWVDYGNSLFVSQDSKLIRGIDGMIREDGYRLLACF